MRQKFNHYTNVSLVSKTFMTCVLTMFLFSVTAFATSVKIYNNTSCVMKIYCKEGNQGTFDMGKLYAGQSKTIYPTSNWGKVYCKNRETGNYANGLDFGYGHYNLYVKDACPQDDPHADDPTDTPDNTPSCDNPEFNPCNNVNILDFSESGFNWGLNDMAGSYTVGEQTFDININDPDGIFAAFQDVQADPDDEGSYENNTGIAVGINPHQTDDALEITYNLSLVSDYVAFTIRDLDRKYYGGSKQIEKVCVFGYLDGVAVEPTITSLCGSVDVSGNCAVGTTSSSESNKDESIRVVFETCINEIKIVYGNDDSAADNPTYSRIYIADDIGFGTAVCTDDCIPCTAEASVISLDDSLGGSQVDVCVEDNSVNVNVTGGNGENSAWVVTDEQTNIISVGETPPFTFSELGTYIIWYLNWDGDLSATPDVGANAGEIVVNSDCAELSNPITVTVIDCCTATASEIAMPSGNVERNICLDDGVEEPIDVVISGGSGENSAWVITDQAANILALPNEPPFILDDAGEGTCLIWYLNWDGDLNGTLEIGANAADLLTPVDSVCAELSNAITVIRENCCTAAQAEIATTGGETELDICVNDETLQTIEFQLVNAGNGENNAWVITDEAGVIVSVSEDAPTFDFYADVEGQIIVWYLNWDGELASMPQAGDSAGDLVSNSFCAKLSNPVNITKTCCCPYTIEFTSANLTCTSANIFPDPVLVLDTNLILDDETLVCNLEGFSPCSGEPAVRNENGDLIAGAITMPGVYVATGCDCAEDVRLEVTQEDLDGCVVVQQGIVAPSICNGGMIAEAPIVNSVFNNSATIQWNPQTNASLQFKAVDSNEWIDVTQRSGFVIIPNLSSCKEYEARLNYPCDNNNMRTSLKQRFTTAGCVSCEEISPELVPLNVTGKSAILSWDVVSGSMYTLYYRSDAAAEWKTYNTVVPFVVLFGLDECSMYEFGLKVTCANARTSDMSSIVQFGNDCGGQKTGSLVITDNSLINIHPNPASSFVDISLTNDATISAIEIYNASGKMMFNQNDLSFDGMKYTAKLDNLAKGLYFISATVEDKVHTKKFLKE